MDKKITFEVVKITGKEGLGSRGQVHDTYNLIAIIPYKDGPLRTLLLTFDHFVEYSFSESGIEVTPIHVDSIITRKV